MGKNTKRVREFIESIPDSKLCNLSKGAGTIFKDTDFRLDMQGMTSGNPQKHNLQVQINKETTITSLKKSAPATVSTFIADAGMSAADVRQKLIDGIKI